MRLFRALWLGEFRGQITFVVQADSLAEAIRRRDLRIWGARVDIQPLLGRGCGGGAGWVEYWLRALVEVCAGVHPVPFLVAGVSHDPRDDGAFGMTLDVSAGGIRAQAGTPPRGLDDEGAEPRAASAWQQAASFAGSMAQFAASGFQTVERDVHQVRVGHCKPCQYRNAARCTLCGCFFEKKAWLPHEDCPIGRWTV